MTAPVTEFPAFKHVLFYGREYEEVLAMVALTEADLAGKRIPDCPSGPDAFVSDATVRGFDVMGCDRLDLGFHRQSVHELIRVCRGELRLYPVMMHGKNRLHPYAASPSKVDRATSSQNGSFGFSRPSSQNSGKRPSVSLQAIARWRSS